MLQEKGKLNVADEITRFIPSYPTHEKKITLHHLLTHTSGIKNYTSMSSIREISKKELTPDELINFFKNQPMDFDPGEAYKYSNSGYVILGRIIELVSGQSYASFMQEHIFDILEMTSSSYASHSKITPNKAYGYHKRKEFINANYISYSLPYAAGSLFSTVEDMLKWQNAITNNRLIKQKK